MRVHGTDGLRLVDASVFPTVTNANIYAPVMMVAEKAADRIAGNAPLAPDARPFYRHAAGMPLFEVLPDSSSGGSSASSVSS
jgi:choline dehydrogenase